MEIRRDESCGERGDKKDRNKIYKREDSYGNSRPELKVLFMAFLWWRELDSNQRRDKLGRFTVCCD
jgi:hypothetical protein